ncbi:MAG: hypothetical protein Q4D17_05010 [Planctomycetia bacterium]|nr:hypothetical protein [Planctomycetia bacterium]
MELDIMQDFSKKSSPPCPKIVLFLVFAGEKFLSIQNEGIIAIEIRAKM